MNLLLHPASQSWIKKYLEDPAQSVLLVGPSGCGKSTILSYLAGVITDGLPQNIINIVPDEGKDSISIDAIRELKRQLKLKSATPRVVIIENAGKVTIEAQNSFLKLLEEPPANVFFLMSSESPNQMLDTIRSRTTIFRITNPSTEQIIEYFKSSDYDLQNLTKNISLCENRIGLISALVKDEEHILIRSIELAKQVLGSNHYSRLIIVESLSKDRDKLSNFLDALVLICKAAMENSAGNSGSVSKWLDRLEKTLDAQKKISSNVHPKLVLSHLFVVL